MNLRRTIAIARKESLHVVRDPRSLGLAIGIPMLMIMIFGYALTLDVDDVRFVVWDQDRTPASRELIAQFEASRYFRLLAFVSGREALVRAIDRGEARLGLVIERGFGEAVGAGRRGRVQAIVDGADSNTASIVLGYTRGVATQFGERLRRAAGARAPVDAPVDLRPRVWFNADLESKNFIIPGLAAVILGLIAALLTSLTIAREWEGGTMEQLVSTPVKPVEVIVGKLVPYFAIGMLDVAIAVSMAVFVFDVPLRGSVAEIMLVSGVFIAGTLGQGIAISAVARGQLLASQMAMVSTFLPAFLLSGFMFAIANMPKAVQPITYIVPARYYVALVKGIFLRGIGAGVLWRDVLFLLGFALLVNAVAIRRFRKRIA